MYSIFFNQFTQCQAIMRLRRKSLLSVTERMKKRTASGKTVSDVCQSSSSLKLITVVVQRRKANQNNFHDNIYTKNRDVTSRR